MKPTFLLPKVASFLILTFLFTACKKDGIPKSSDESSHLSNENGDINVAKVEVVNGILHFKDYNEYFQSMMILNSLNAQQRHEWEEKMKFKSLRSYYDDFNRELDIIEISGDSSTLQNIRNKYSNEVVWNTIDSTFDVNAPGLMEAGLLNKAGFVVVNKELLSYKHDVIRSFDLKDEEISLSRQAEEAGKLIWSARSNRDFQIMGVNDYNVSGSDPGSSSFVYGEGLVKTVGPVDVTNHDARGNARVRIFNFKINGITRGFATVKFHADHKNWLGQWRKVQSFGGAIIGGMRVVLSSQGTFTFNVNNFPGGSPNWDNAQDVENEVVVIASKFIKDNPTTPPFIPGPFYSQYANTEFVIEENGSSPNYWSLFAPNLNGAPLYLKFISFGNGPLPKDHVFDIYFE